jgi:hypothetical protein
MAADMDENEISIGPDDIRRPTPVSNEAVIPHCEKSIKYMFRATCIPAIRNPWRFIRIGIPLLINTVLVSSWFCMLYYPDYYPTQGEVWTADLVLITIVYNYMMYLQSKWRETNAYENIIIEGTTNSISLGFYWLYQFYWLYFAVIQFNNHNTPSAAIQLQNTLMSTAWYFFFSTAGCLYYFMCTKLAQRAKSIDEWMRKIKKEDIPISVFYLQYNWHYKQIKLLSHHWNAILFAGFLLLMFHVPIDLVSIIYRKYYYDIPGLIIKLTSLLWYTWRICDLNEYENIIIARLYKYRTYSVQEIQDFQKYALCRPVGLNFYGIKINKGFVTKILIVILNLGIPTLYALLKNNIFKV